MRKCTVYAPYSGWRSHAPNTEELNCAKIHFSKKFAKKSVVRGEKFAKKNVFLQQKQITMLVLTEREFRANLSKYFDAARSGEDVVVKSRAGVFRIVPIQKNYMIVNKDELNESLRKSLLEVKNTEDGKGKLLTWEEFQNEMER